jgi:hypothetical protein
MIGYSTWAGRFGERERTREGIAVKTPRISIAVLMGAVIIAALGLLAYRIDLGDGRVYRLYHEYVISVVSTACLLLSGTAAEATGHGRRNGLAGSIGGDEAPGRRSRC